MTWHVEEPEPLPALSDQEKYLRRLEHERYETLQDLSSAVHDLFVLLAPKCHGDDAIRKRVEEFAQHMIKKYHWEDMA